MDRYALNRIDIDQAISLACRAAVRVKEGSSPTNEEIHAVVTLKKLLGEVKASAESSILPPSIVPEEDAVRLLGEHKASLALAHLGPRMRNVRLEDLPRLLDLLEAAADTKLEAGRAAELFEALRELDPPPVQVKARGVGIPDAQ